MVEDQKGQLVQQVCEVHLKVSLVYLANQVVQEKEVPQVLQVQLALQDQWVLQGLSVEEVNLDHKDVMVKMAGEAHLQINVGRQVLLGQQVQRVDHQVHQVQMVEMVLQEVRALLVLLACKALRVPEVR